METLLEIKDLYVWYKVFGGFLKVLDGLNLNVRSGERVGVVGESGCGKTTTAKSILRILPEKDFHIPKGEILFKGEDILRMRADQLQKVRSSGIAMIFQDPTAALNPVFTIGSQLFDVIHFASSNDHAKHERTKNRLKRVAISALKDVSMPDQERLLGNYPIQLSGGMRQRVCISMALTASRDLLIADEPGTSLDVTIQDQILRLLRELVAKQNTSILLITHSLGVAREMTDRIYVMYAGTTIETAKSRDLFKNPLHPYTVGLLSSVPRLSGGGIARGIPGRIPDYLNPPTGCRFHPRCLSVMPICSEQKPSFVELGDEHSVACFHYSKE
jgi:peptide/nickel transport system ATP-binding protein